VQCLALVCDERSTPGADQLRTALRLLEIFEHLNGFQSQVLLNLRYEPHSPSLPFVVSTRATAAARGSTLQRSLIGVLLKDERSARTARTTNRPAAPARRMEPGKTYQGPSVPNPTTPRRKQATARSPHRMTLCFEVREVECCLLLSVRLHGHVPQPNEGTDRTSGSHSRRQVDPSEKKNPHSG
jgi:hypothetical protein